MKDKIIVSRWEVFGVAVMVLCVVLYSYSPDFPFSIGLRWTSWASVSLHLSILLLFDYMDDRAWYAANYLNILIAGFGLHYSGGINSPFLPILVLLPLSGAGYGMNYLASTACAAGVFIFVITAEYLGLLTPITFSSQAVYASLPATLFVACFVCGLFGVGISVYQQTVVYLRRRLDAELAQNQKVIMKLSSMNAPSQAGLLARKLAHDVRGPLGAVTGFLELLADDGSLKPAQRADCRLMRREMERVGTLLTRTLQYLKHDDGVMKEEKIKEILEPVLSVMRFYPGAKDVRFQREYSNFATHRVRARRQQLQQVYFNLLKNAVEAVQENPGPKAVEVDVREDDGMVRIVVADNGPGMPGDLLDKAIGESVSTKEDGNGLGLLIVKEIMDAHRGRFSIRNRPEGGLEAATWLPLQTSGH